MKTEKIQLAHGEAVLISYLHDLSPKFPNAERRQTVLILPGGGYATISDREAEPVALAYLAEGFNAFVLRYTVGEGAHWPQPLEDAQAALDWIVDHSGEYHVDTQRIALVGFSAGGHLAAAVGTQGRRRPSALVLGYPCLGQPQCGLMPMHPPALLGAADDKTPPTFLFSTYEDEVVPVTQTLRFAAELAEKEIPVECHVFQYGIHGLSLAKPFTSSGRIAKVDESVQQWHPMSVQWLRRLWGDYPTTLHERRPTAESLGAYCIDALGGSLMENQSCMRILCEYYPPMCRKEYAWGARPVTIRDLNAMLPHGMALTEEKLRELDEALRQVPLPEREA